MKINSGKRPPAQREGTLLGCRHFEAYSFHSLLIYSHGALHYQCCLFIDQTSINAQEGL